MITVYYQTGDTIQSAHLAAGDPLPAGVLWIDILSPTPEEERSIETQLAIQIPTREEVWRNEVLNRFYNEHGVSYMTAAIISRRDAPHPETSGVTFILAESYLVTMRYISPTSFKNFAEHILAHPKHFSTSTQLLAGLLEEIITRVAYNSEIVVQELTQLSHTIFDKNGFHTKDKNPSEAMKSVLQKLGACSDLNSTLNESLHSLHRMLNVFHELKICNPDVQHSIRTQLTDIAALTRQTGFIADKITFQLDATLGMINVEQNMIIKIFSVVAVFFMPPTLIASLYGMNFQVMPELHWQYGYVYALGMMILCALVPYFYFRKKGWL